MSSLVEARPYNWPHDGPPLPTNTALIVIDMQNDFCATGGYLESQGYDITPIRSIIPSIRLLLSRFRALKYTIIHAREGHRPDLSTLSSRELFRSRNNPSGLGIGDLGPLGRLLVRGKQGWDIIPELKPLEGEVVIDKAGKSAFAHTDLDLILRNKGVRNLVLVGVTTDVCVHTTMREANDRGYDCCLVSDASMASEEKLHQAAVEMVRTEGGIFGAVAKSFEVMKAVT